MRQSAEKPADIAILFEKGKEQVSGEICSGGRPYGCRDTDGISSSALAFELLPQDMRAKAAHLVENLKNNGWHLSTGFIGVRLLNPVLTQMGYADVAYRLLNNKTYPSWLYPVLHGATTIWERWDGWTAEKGFHPR